jgi:hypothetical protein
MKRLRLVALTLAVAAAAIAQSPVGTIAGTVRDSTGLATTAVHVVVRSEDTGQQFTVETNESGDYLVRAVPPGRYTVTAAKDGFKQALHPNMTLTAYQNLRVDMILEVGSLQQQVEVVDQAPLVDTREAVNGALIDDRRIVDLPLNGRNVDDLLSMVPGVSRVLSLGPTAATAASEENRININGARIWSTATTLDGGSMYAANTGDGFKMPPPDTVEEIKVITSGATAEYSSGSSLFSVITKSGTNSIHGTLWEYLRNDKLDSRGFFDQSVAAYRYNQFGGTIGGPIVKNRLFYFGSYQGSRIRQQESKTTAFPPTAAQRAGDFSGTTIVDPSTGAAFPGNKIPASRFDPVAVKLLGLVPLANSPTGQLLALEPQPSSGEDVVGKFDHLASARDRLSYRYYFDWRRAVEQFPGIGGQAKNIPNYSASDSSVDIQAQSVNYTRIWTPNLLSITRGSFSRWTNDAFNVNHTTLGDLGSNLTDAGGGLPRPAQIAVTGLFAMGPGKDVHSIESNYELAQTWSWIHGRHEVKWGGLYHRVGFYTYNDFATCGSFTFNGTFTKNAVADLLLGLPVTFEQSSLEFQVGHRYDPGFFAQDTFKLSRRLTLSLGLRWEVYTAWHADRAEVGGQTDSLALAMYVKGAQSRTFPNAPPGMIFSSDPQFAYNTDAVNPAPRIGFAWDVTGDGKTSVRGGYGISYDGDIAQGTLDNNQPWYIDVTSTNPGTLLNPWGTNKNPFPIDTKAAVFTLPATIGGNLVAPVKTAYTQNVNLTIQRQISRDWMLQTGYVANLGRHIQTIEDQNAAVYIPGNGANGQPLSSTRNTDQRRPLAPYYTNLNGEGFIGNSSYNALQTSVTKRMSGGLIVFANYTWSKALDEVCTVELRGQCHPQNPNNIRGDRGPGDYDHRHLANVSWVYELPHFRHSPSAWLRQGIGNWQLSGMSTFQTGSPINISTGQDISLTGVGNDRPNVVGDPSLPGGRSKSAELAQWFNTAAFVSNLTGQFGDLGRNAIYGPGRWNFDLSLQKVLTFHERHRVEFRAEFFNALNHANFNNPGSTLTTARTFGVISAAGAPRSVQFALRYKM